MKKIGIIGGLGPESTVDYYQRIMSLFKNEYPDLLYPEIIIQSVNMNDALTMLADRRWDDLAEWLANKVALLNAAGAEFAVIASNTPHVVFDRLEKMATLPLISIVEATCEVIAAAGYKNVGLLGTRFTMEEHFYHTSLERLGVGVVVPRSEDREYIHEKLFTEIELGIFRDETREGLLSIVESMIENEHIDAVINGCTELPLILPEPVYTIPFLNTTEIHCRAIVSYCTG